MRLIQIPIKNYDALIHDIIKNTTILLSIEVLQTLAMGESLFDPMFLNIVLFTIIGNLIFYLMIDRYILGSGPILSGELEQ
jgi:hypothetical protein